MTISTNTVYVNNGVPGWNRANVMQGLESAFSWARLHGEPLTGLVQSVSATSGGGTYNGGDVTWYDRTQNTTSGIGTGASFKVVRSGATDTVTSVVINRPGRNYSNGETLIISAENIGRAVNGAANLSVTINTIRDGFGNPVSYGTTQTFFDKDFSDGNPWGVLRTVQDNSKAYGETYWYFRNTSTSTLEIGSSAKYHPYYRRWAGEPGFDGDTSDPTTNGSSDLITGGSLKSTTIQYSNGDQSYPLEISCFRSGLDPDFAIFSFKQPTLASSTLANQTYQTFFLHNYTSTFFDLDEVWMEGISIVSRANSFQTSFCGANYTNGATNSPSFRFGVYGSVSNNSDHKMSHSRRAAEAGYWRAGQNRPWTQYHSQVYGGTSGCSGETTSNDYSFINYQSTTVATQRIYYRSNIFDGTTPDMNFNAVIKGLPISATYVPCPYYLPDDIVLIDFYYPQSSAFIAQFDTVTISPTEVYTVIDASYNQSGATRGMLLCGRII
jgi:hypothetical protein